MVKFISNKPFQFIGYRQIPNYPITSNRIMNDGIIFNGRCELTTDDEVLISGLRLLIERHEQAVGLPQNAKLLSIVSCPIYEESIDCRATVKVSKALGEAISEDSDASNPMQELIRLLRR